MFSYKQNMKNHDQQIYLGIFRCNSHPDEMFKIMYSFFKDKNSKFLKNLTSDPWKDPSKL